MGLEYFLNTKGKMMLFYLLGKNYCNFYKMKPQIFTLDRRLLKEFENLLNCREPTIIEKGDYMDVVGTIFIKERKILIDKPRKRPTYQMIGGKVEENETPLEAAIRECHEELGKLALFNKNKFVQVLEFNEIATSDGVTPIHFFVFKYEGLLEGKLTESDEIEKFMWYDTSDSSEILSNTLKHKVIPYCKENNLID